MIKDITIGQYFATDSIIHKLDPRVKVTFVFLYIIAIFLISKLWVYAPVLVFLIAIIKISKIKPNFVFKGVKPLLPIILLTFILNVLMTPGEVVWKWKIFTVTKAGLNLGFFMAFRLIFLVLGTSLLTLTTSPIELTDAMEKMLHPFAKFGFPAHQFAMMMTIALRFIPTLFEETDKIMKAQMARGADFESGNIIKRAKNLVPLLVPLFINALKIAGELAVAMEARCYRGGEGRTRLNELSYQKRDFIAYGVIILLFILIIVSRII
ncbi:energy-coupling factor transporter transmembrane protein EcfT [Finegoldia magna]|uniref:Energy-coupling factor transporter transmembrane protein EcfT n=1 Tax=Finegoldia magna ATCC 53516 TaxID=525282 RepID=D6S740_FINMA|nr:energy-coupling factor transporter transmembrane component T [Finegoldia magna]EFH93894.1 cobalt transport protein [Finegoldia magna ATCC 53516]MBS5942560.1 energy-coupling factor transporter transmembrane protein EcfT [Finegoldia magna]MCA5587751.1 energy-coupling factor transporter transmembrane protein EcfT [Finegoldia magna]MDU1579318.1 energy-coupling factor transporter transmembrane component T [Finegoldia magna]MDU1599863.1 energy-coupling factor transporter transmembrane component T